MKPFEYRYAPGQVHAAWFKRETAIVALEGTLRLSYRDASLDWLLGDAPRVSVVLCEGERHVLPYEAFVEVRAAGQRATLAGRRAGRAGGTARRDRADRHGSARADDGRDDRALARVDWPPERCAVSAKLTLRLWCQPVSPLKP